MTKAENPKYNKAMFNIVLYEPEIPQNTGNIARTCACTRTALHLIKPLGFDVSESAIKRAGLDYWDKVDVFQYENWDDFLKKHDGANCYFFTKKADRIYTDVSFKDGDFLVFGKETKGLPDSVLQANSKNALRLPMREGVRCLNLSNSAAIALYEALRQTGFAAL